jgi:hypothetical protein
MSAVRILHLLRCRTIVTRALRYIAYLASWKKAEESLRRLQRNQKATFSLFGSAKSNKDDKARDDQRIRTQMILDVQAFGQDAESLGVDIRAFDSYSSLVDMVNTSLTDGELPRSP